MEHVQARVKVNNLIYRGLMAPARTFACVDCGVVAEEYDHADYSKPLEVQPVCSSCHRKRTVARITHCKRGHAFDVANTRQRSGAPHRVCRTCDREVYQKTKPEKG